MQNTELNQNAATLADLGYCATEGALASIAIRRDVHVRASNDQVDAAWNTIRKLAAEMEGTARNATPRQASEGVPATRTRVWELQTAVETLEEKLVVLKRMLANATEFAEVAHSFDQAGELLADALDEAAAK